MQQLVQMAVQMAAALRYVEQTKRKSTKQSEARCSQAMTLPYSISIMLPFKRIYKMLPICAKQWATPNDMPVKQAAMTVK